jgi:predicted nucleic acid-binding protein
MIAYLDSSVILRLALKQANPLREWEELDLGVSSALLRVECHRTLDRLWQTGNLDEPDFSGKREEVLRLLRFIDVSHIDDTVLRRASASLPVPLGTLDAIHLATALVYRESQPDDERPILFATHDKALARAAEAMRFEVIGS